jgi:hypothetical protein
MLFRPKLLFTDKEFPTIFVSVFHRILDFKAGLDFYLGPLFFRSRFCSYFPVIFTNPS